LLVRWSFGFSNPHYTKFAKTVESSKNPSLEQITAVITEPGRVIFHFYTTRKTGFACIDRIETAFEVSKNGSPIWEVSIFIDSNLRACLSTAQMFVT